MRAENVRLSRLLELRGLNTAPAPEQLSAAVAPPGLVVMSSPVQDKLVLYTDRFRTRTDVYAVRRDNARTGVNCSTTRRWCRPMVAGGSMRGPRLGYRSRTPPGWHSDWPPPGRWWLGRRRPAAWLGREFDATLLAPMTGFDGETVGPVLRASVRMQLLGPVPGTPDRLRFRHALRCDAVDETLSPTERVALAGAGLDTVEALCPGVPPPWCDLAARLAVAAGRRVRAAGLLVAAGRDATGRGALAAGVALLDDAVGQAAGDLDATATAEEALVETLALAGDAQRALRVGYRLLRTWRRLARRSTGRSRPGWRWRGPQPPLERCRKLTRRLSACPLPWPIGRRPTRCGYARRRWRH